MKAAFLQYTNVPLSVVLQSATVMFMLRRKQVKTFPVFFAYTIFHLVQAALSFIAFRISYTAYFYEWWAGEMLDILATFAVIQEIFLVTFRPYEELRRWGSRLYIAGALSLSVIALVMGFEHPEGYSPRVSALLTLDRSASFVQVGLLLFLFLACRLFGMTWRHYVFGIASGFAVMSAMTTVGEAIRTHYATYDSVVDTFVMVFNAVAFTLAAGVWTYYFGSKKSRVALDHVIGTERLVAWNQALAGLGRS